MTREDFAAAEARLTTRLSTTVFAAAGLVIAAVRSCEPAAKHGTGQLDKRVAAVEQGQESALLNGADFWTVGRAPSGAIRRRLAGEGPAP